MEYHLFTVRFDERRLFDDLKRCQGLVWPTHFNTKDYTGKWSSLSLRSASGSETDIFSNANAVYQDTPLLSRCGYFREVIDFFECPKETVRLLSLSPGSFIREHRDPDAGYQDGFFRIHIPIQTNPEVVFKLNGKQLPMQPGDCWYADFTLPHFVSNAGEQDRIHLVIDCIRNDWSDHLFREAGYDFEKDKEVYVSEETKRKMISELEHFQTETSRKLITDLKAQLANATVHSNLT